MKLRILFIMDPIHTIDIEKDTTFVFMLESQGRGHEIWYAELKDLFVKGGETWGTVLNLALQRDTDFYEIGGEETVLLESFDVVWMRKDPPFSLEYIYATYYLSLIDSSSTLVINNPGGIRESNEKLYSLYFPKVIPLSLVTMSVDGLKKFLEDVGGEMVVKPLDGHGGEGVFYVKKGDKNANVILESITHLGTRYVLAQEFIEDVSIGDKRIILLNGEPLGAVLRVAKPGGEFRCNFHSGGSPEKTDLEEKDWEICRAIAPRLVRDGLYFVGIDVVGGFLTEINTTSPTGIQEINRLNGTKLEAQVIDFVEEKISSSKFKLGYQN
jgi:glutathione synthase